MIGLVARRLGWAVVVTWFVLTVTFVLADAIPADPAKAILGPHATPELIDTVRTEYCLDRGVVVRYGCWIDRLVHGDLGESYRTRRPVTELLGARIWPTVQLALAAIALQLLIGVPLGVIAAARRKRWPDHAATAISLLGQSVPAFVTGTFALYLFAYVLDWFPIGGYGEPGLDRLWHLVLPAATLATIGIAFYARAVRGELVEVLGEDYIRTARAKGLSESRVIGPHALRKALGPLVTLVGLDLGVLIGGAVVIESVFAWPGLGREVLLAILELDLPVILGVVMVTAIGIAIANLLVDLVQLALDPRLRS
jgi:peptide/nickel transport system permease protein